MLMGRRRIWQSESERAKAYRAAKQVEARRRALAAANRADPLPKVKLPYGPLEAYLRPLALARFDDENVAERTGSGEAIPVLIANLCRVDRSSVYRWREEGLSLDVADRVAREVGQHPTAIWGDAYWVGCDVDLEVAVP